MLACVRARGITVWHWLWRLLCAARAPQQRTRAASRLEPPRRARRHQRRHRSQRSSSRAHRSRREGGPGAVRAEFGAVTSVEPHATRAGIAILEQGGNAIDAAVAVAYALAVTHPSAGNLGGGGFLLVRPKGGPTSALDFRESAPLALTRSRFDAMQRAGGMGAGLGRSPGQRGGPRARARSLRSLAAGSGARAGNRARARSPLGRAPSRATRGQLQRAVARSGGPRHLRQG